MGTLGGVITVLIGSGILLVMLDPAVRAKLGLGGSPAPSSTSQYPTGSGTSTVTPFGVLPPIPIVAIPSPPIPPLPMQGVPTLTGASGTGT